MNTAASNSSSERPRHLMSAEAFAHWGMGAVAYIKPTDVNGRKVYVIHAADGEAMAQALDPDTAAALVVQHDMQPVSAH